MQIFSLMVNMSSIKGEHLMKQVLSLEIDLGDSSFLVCPHFPDLSKFIFMGDTVSEANSNNNFTIHECSSYNMRFSALLDEVDFITRNSYEPNECFKTTS